MRIRSILITAVWAAIAMALLLAVSAYFFSQRLSEIATADEHGRASSSAVAELLVLTNEYAMHAESRAARQWKAQFEILLESFNGDVNGGHKAMLDQANMLPVIFSKLEEMSNMQVDILQARRKEFFLDQLLTNVRALSDSVHRWSNDVAEKRLEIEYQLHIVMIAIPVFLLLILIVLALLIKQRVLKPLARLHSAVITIAKGDFSARPHSEAQDELGDLTRTFNTMAIDMVSGLRAEVAERLLAESRLAQSELRLNTIIETEPECVKIVDANGVLQFMNAAGLAMIEADSLSQVAGHGVIGIIAPDHREAFTALHKKVIAGESGQLQFEIIGLKGGHRWLETHAVPLRGADTTQLLSITRDITKQRSSEEKLKLAASVFTHAREGIMITDAIGTIIDVNDTFCQITDYRRDEVLGKSAHMLSSGRHSEEYYAKLWEELLQTGTWQGEIWNRRKNGEVYAEMQTISAVHDEAGNVTHYVALFSDITSLKEYETQLEHIAHYDALTSLPNRVLLSDRLHQGMAQVQRRGLLLAVGYIDLDGFKAVNDNHGHDIGDLLLIAVSSRMKQALREGDTLARLGGDEFVAVLLDLTDAEASIPMLKRLLAAAAEPVRIGELELQVSASLGVTFFPQGGEVDADQLLRQADRAMYQAKEAGRNRYVMFDGVGSSA